MTDQDQAVIDAMAGAIIDIDDPHYGCTAFDKAQAAWTAAKTVLAERGMRLLPDATDVLMCVDEGQDRFVLNADRLRERNAVVTIVGDKLNWTWPCEYEQESALTELQNQGQEMEEAFERDGNDRY